MTMGDRLPKTAFENSKPFSSYRAAGRRQTLSNYIEPNRFLINTIQYDMYILLNKRNEMNYNSGELPIPIPFTRT